MTRSGYSYYDYDDGKQGADGKTKAPLWPEDLALWHAIDSARDAGGKGETK